MTEIIKDKNNFLPIIIGIAIGAVAIYILLRKSQSVQQLQQPIILPVDLSSIEQRLLRIETQISSPAQQNIPQISSPAQQNIPQISSPAQQNIPPAQQNIPPAQQNIPQISSPAQQNTYKNSEKWKVLRDINGDITNIEVDRNAKVM